jgi:hypothetical protein
MDPCLFAVRLETPVLATLVHDRIAALVRFYGGAAEAVASTQAVAGGHVVVGAIPLFERSGDDRDTGAGLTRTWGERSPLSSRTADQIVTASDAELRGLQSVGVTFAAANERVRIVHGGGGPTALYRSAVPALRAWSTHALAAAWLASGEVQLDFERLPELLAFDFVGASGTLIRGASAVPPATSVILDRAGAAETCYWPAAERWKPVDHRAAQKVGEEALISSLACRLESEPAPRLALTAGMDSRVVALALRDAGVSFEAFTWGDSEWPDPRGAEALARTLGIGHTTYPPEWLSEEAAIRQMRSAARLGDGVSGLALGTRTWPSDGSVFVSGMGGETGRAFYYAPGHVEHHPRPRNQDLLDALSPETRIAGALPEAIAAARDGAARWLGIAHESGVRGWSMLDVAYAEQRVAHWGRSQCASVPKPLVPAFTAVEVARALASQSPHDRLNSAFHQRFLARRGEAYHSPARRRLRSYVPAPARRAWRRLRPPGPGSNTREPVDPLLLALWRERPRLRSWVADDVLRRSELVHAMGEHWTNTVRQDFLEGRRRATEQAQLAAGPFTLQDELGHLHRSWQT